MATVGASSGVVTGVSVGTAVITCTIPGCTGTVTVTVNSMPVVSHVAATSLSVCVGNTITLTDATPGGTWSVSSSNATVSGGIVSGVSPGTDTIKYTITNSCGTVTSDTVITVINCSYLGVNNMALAQHIILYPNPANQELTIETSLPEYHSYHISNLMGQLISSGAVTSQSTKVSIASLPPGMYYITLEVAGGDTVGRFVKM